MLAQFGELYAMEPEERFQATNGLISEKNDKAWEGHGPIWGLRTYAYAAWLHNRPELIPKVTGTCFWLRSLSHFISRFIVRYSPFQLPRMKTA